MKPSYIYLSATSRCNLSCLYCKTWKSEDNELRLDQLKKILLKMKDWLGPFTVEIAGGEPLLRKDITQIIKFCTVNKIITKITTNGTLLNKKLSEDLENAGLSSLNISLDGIGEVNDKTRGKGTFDKITKNLRQVNMPITISTVITSHNKKHLNELSEFCEKNKYDLIIQGFITNLGYKEDNKRLWPKNPTFENIKTINSQLDQIKEYYKNKKGKSCESYNNFIINEQGKVQICFYMKPIGNLLKESPEPIWNSDKAKKLRKKIQTCNKSCSLLNCNQK